MKKVAVIGCGAVSQLYYSPALRSLQKHEMLKVDSVYDPDPDNRLKLFEQFPEAEMIVDFSRLGAREIDLAIVASPPDMHARQSIELMKMGINVLCEKPLATKVSDALEMISVSKSANRILAVGLFRRFFPAIQSIRKIIEIGLLGEIRSVECTEGNIFRWPVKSPSYFHKHKGGVLMDVGVHSLDLLLWWFGTPGQIQYEDDAMGGIETNCLIKMVFNEKIEASVRLSRDTDLPNEYVINGSKSTLIWDVNEADNVRLEFHDNKYGISGQIIENSIPPRPAANFEQSFISQLKNVITVIDGKEDLFVAPEEAIESIKLIEYCYNHRNLMKLPWLSEIESINAYHLKRV